MSSDLEVIQGKTFGYTLQYGAPPIKYAPITAITQAAPAVVTATAHGIPDGWPVAVVSVKGMKQINAQNSPPKETEYVKATVLSANSVELNTVNAAEFSPYTSGGYLQYDTPVDLSGATARMQIRANTGAASPVLYELNTTPGLTKGTIALDNTKKTITCTIPVAHSDLFAWKTGVYSLELTIGSVVTLIAEGKITYTQDATRG